MFFKCAVIFNFMFLIFTLFLLLFIISLLLHQRAKYVNALDMISFVVGLRLISAFYERP